MVDGGGGPLYDDSPEALVRRAVHVDPRTGRPLTAPSQPDCPPAIGDVASRRGRGPLPDGLQLPPTATNGMDRPDVWIPLRSAAQVTSSWGVGSVAGGPAPPPWGGGPYYAGPPLCDGGMAGGGRVGSLVMMDQWIPLSIPPPQQYNLSPRQYSLSPQQYDSRVQQQRPRTAGSVLSSEWIPLASPPGGRLGAQGDAGGHPHFDPLQPSHLRPNHGDWMPLPPGSAAAVGAGLEGWSSAGSGAGSGAGAPAFQGRSATSLPPRPSYSAQHPSAALPSLPYSGSGGYYTGAASGPYTALLTHGSGYPSAPAGGLQPSSGSPFPVMRGSGSGGVGGLRQPVQGSGGVGGLRQPVQAWVAEDEASALPSPGAGGGRLLPGSGGALLSPRPLASSRSWV